MKTFMVKLPKLKVFLYNFKDCPKIEQFWASFSQPSNLGINSSTFYLKRHAFVNSPKSCQLLRLLLSPRPFNIAQSGHTVPEALTD